MKNALHISLYMLFSLRGETMAKTKNELRLDFVPAIESMRKLATETGAFQIGKVSAGGKRAEIHQLKPDHLVTILVAPDHRQVELFVYCRQSLVPNALFAIFHKLQANRPEGIVLLYAPYISPRVAEMCQEQKVSYLDGAGNCWLAAPGLFLHISSKPNRSPTTKSIDPFSKKSSRVVRTLLTHPQKGWQVQQLAQQSNVSLGLASKVKHSLIEEAYVVERDRLLFLRDSRKLLQGWSAEYVPQVKQVHLFAIPRPAEVEKRLAQWCERNQIEYALTQLAGAWRYSSMVRYEKSVFYLDSELESANKQKSLLEFLDAKEVDSGANCVLWIAEDSAVFADTKDFDGVRVVSPIQLYLDLMALPGRGPDAAQEIFERELQPLLTASALISGTEQ